MAKKRQKTKHIEAVEADDKWQTECDYRTLEEYANIRKDPMRIKRLKAYIKEKKEDIETFDAEYLSKIGLKEEK